MEISLDSDHSLTLCFLGKSGKERRCKWNRGLDEDNVIQVVLRKLVKPDGLSTEGCNQVLDEMASSEMHDPLYSTGSVILYESASIR